MAIIDLQKLNERGLEAFEAFIRSAASLNKTERNEKARDILSVPEHLEPVDGAGMIDTAARFSTALDFAEHVFPAIEALGRSGIRERGINAFLWLVYFDQFVGGSVRQPNAYLLDSRHGGVGTLRNYRNNVFVFLSFYSLHSASRRICEALLGAPPSLLPSALERISQMPYLMGSRGAMELVITMFLVPGKAVFRPAPKTATARRTTRAMAAADAMKELSTIVFRQCNRNYDVSRMSREQLLKLVPKSKTLSPWRAFAQKEMGDVA